MEPPVVWMKLRNSTKDSFMVDINKPNTDIDDLKRAINALKNVNVEYIYSEDGHEENGKCSPDDLILSHGQAGKFGKQPHFYTIEPPLASAPPDDLPHFPFIVNRKPFTVKYAVSPKPPKTIKQVLDFIEERTGIKGGILDINGSQMENDDLFEKQAFDPKHPTYRFKPAVDTPQPQEAVERNRQELVPEIPTENTSPLIDQAVDHYSQVGRELAGHPQIQALRSEFINTRNTATGGVSGLFFYAIIAPSGSGKTQLPFALQTDTFKTIHLVMNDSYSEFTQPIYSSVLQRSLAIYRAAQRDVMDYYGFLTKCPCAKLLTFPNKLKTVSVILQLLGVRGPLEPLELNVLIKHVKAMNQIDKPVFFLDEVSFDDTESTININKKSIVSLIRNLLRLAGLVVVLMGTDMSTKNFIAMPDVCNDSRRLGEAIHWCRLIANLPKLSDASKAALGVDLAILQIKAFAQANDYSHDEINYLNSFLNFMENQFRTCIPLFAELFVLAWKEIMQSTGHFSVDYFVHHLLLCMSSKLYDKKDRLYSNQGIHAQYALQLCRYRIDARYDNRDNPALVKELKDLQSQSNRFVASHFASIVINNDAAVLIGDGIKSLDLYVRTTAGDQGLKYRKNLSVPTLSVWEPLALFPSAADDALLYILLGGGRTIQSTIGSNRFPDPFVITDEQLDRSVCLSARSSRQKFDTFCNTQSIPSSHTNEENSNALTNSSNDPFESIGCVAAILASHTNGMSGLSLQSFLPAFVHHLSLWCCKYDLGNMPVVAWSDEQTVGEMLGSFADRKIPYLSPITSDFPDVAYEIPQPWWYLGLLSRKHDKETVDVTIEVRCDADDKRLDGRNEGASKEKKGKREASSTISSLERPGKKPTTIQEEKTVETSTTVSSKPQTRSISKQAIRPAKEAEISTTLSSKKPRARPISIEEEEEADIAGVTPTTNTKRISVFSGPFTTSDGSKVYWNKSLVRIEMKHHKDVLKLDVLRNCLQRMEGVSIYILLCSETQEDYFTEKGSWSKFCTEHEHCSRLNAIRVVVDNDSGSNPTISLDWLSKVHMPPVKWQDCENLFIVIGVAQLNFLTKNAGRHEKADA